MSTRRSEVQKIARKFANGWIPPIFKWKKRYAVIYQGERYESRKEWSERVGLTTARLTQLVKSGEAHIEVYYTSELA